MSHQGTEDVLLLDDIHSRPVPITKKPFFLVVSGIAAFLLLVLIVGVGTLYLIEWNSEDRILAEPQLNKTLLIISLDGFRWDYLDLYKENCPTLWKIASEGVRATRMIPVYPSKTFPNHYTLVTGLYPESHGIVANTFYDPVFDATFTIDNQAAVSDSRWWGGEPIWVTAVKQNLLSATYFWPGSEAEIAGRRPTYWFEYEGPVPYNQRVSQVLSWLELPPESRPSFLSLYLEKVDSMGHVYGPNSQEVRDAVELVDQTLGSLVEKMNELGVYDQVDLIITADHGMAPIYSDRVILLDQYINMTDVTVVDWSPNLYLIPNDGKEQQIYDTLKNAHPNLTIYWKDEIPERYHYRNNRRITPIFGTTDAGWSTTTTSYFQQHPSYYTGGNHGWDNQYTDMQAIFMARGPSFKKGVVVDPFENLHVYGLMCHILGIEPAPNNGTWTAVSHLLVNQGNS